MKIAENFWELCRQELEPRNTNDSNYYHYYRRNNGVNGNRIIELEARDFERAIALCKEYNKAVHKKEYKFLLEDFNNGTFKTISNDNKTFAYGFVDDLVSNLSYRKRYGSTGTIRRDVELQFSETELMSRARKIHETFVNYASAESSLNQSKTKFDDTKSKLLKAQDLITSGFNPVDLTDQKINEVFGYVKDKD